MHAVIHGWLLSLARERLYHCHRDRSEAERRDLGTAAIGGTRKVGEQRPRRCILTHLVAVTKRRLFLAPSATYLLPTNRRPALFDCGTVSAMIADTMPLTLRIDPWEPS